MRYFIDSCGLESDLSTVHQHVQLSTAHVQIFLISFHLRPNSKILLSRYTKGARRVYTSAFFRLRLRAFMMSRLITANLIYKHILACVKAIVVKVVTIIS